MSSHYLRRITRFVRQKVENQDCSGCLRRRGKRDRVQRVEGRFPPGSCLHSWCDECRTANLPCLVCSVNCSICLEPIHTVFNQLHQVGPGSSPHVVHMHCMVRMRTCPLCRVAVPGGDWPRVGDEWIDGVLVSRRTRTRRPASDELSEQLIAQIQSEDRALIQNAPRRLVQGDDVLELIDVVDHSGNNQLDPLPPPPPPPHPNDPVVYNHHEDIQPPLLPLPENQPLEPSPDGFQAVEMDPEGSEASFHSVEPLDIVPEVVLIPGHVEEAPSVVNFENRNLRVIRDAIQPDAGVYYEPNRFGRGVLYSLSLDHSFTSALPLCLRQRREYHIPRTLVNSMLMWWSDKNFEEPDLIRTGRTYSLFLQSRMNLHNSNELEQINQHLTLASLYQFRERDPQVKEKFFARAVIFGGQVFGALLGLFLVGGAAVKVARNSTYYTAKLTRPARLF